MGNIAGITIVFENTESANVKAEDIGIFYCGKIKRQYAQVACNSIMRQDVSHETWFELLPSADHKYDALMDTGEKLFQRIRTVPDITSIEISYDNGAKEEVYFSWNEDDEYQNKYQTHILGKDGHLYIAVNKKHDIGWYLKKAGIHPNKKPEGKK